MYPVETCGEWVTDDVLFDSEESFVEYVKLTSRTDGRPATYEPEAAKQLLLVRRVWYLWSVAWGVMNETPDYDEDDYKQVWADLGMCFFLYRSLYIYLSLVINVRLVSVGDRTEVAVHNFVKAWVAVVGATQGLYLHLLHAHLPDQIRAWGHLGRRQTQGLEHKHSERKEIGRRCTNRKPGQRALTMLTHSIVVGACRRADDGERHTFKKEQYKRAKFVRLTAKFKRFEALYPEHYRPKPQPDLPAA